MIERENGKSSVTTIRANLHCRIDLAIRFSNDVSQSRNKKKQLWNNVINSRKLWNEVDEVYGGVCHKLLLLNELKITRQPHNKDNTTYKKTWASKIVLTQNDMTYNNAMQTTQLIIAEDINNKNTKQSL